MGKSSKTKVAEEADIKNEVNNKNAVNNINITPTKKNNSTKRKAIDPIAIPNAIEVVVRSYKIETPNDEVRIYKYIASTGPKELQMLTYEERVHNTIQSVGPVILIENYRVARIPTQFRQYKYCDGMHEYNLDGSTITASTALITPNLLLPLNQDTVVCFGRVNKISSNILSARTDEIYNSIILLTSNKISRPIRNPKQAYNGKQRICQRFH